MASKAMVTYCISTTWHRSRSLLSWRFLVWPKFTFISYVLTLLLSGSTCTKKNLDLRWIGGCEKILFEVRSKRDKKGLGHSVGKMYQKCLISNSENETFCVEFHALCFLMNVSLPYSHPKFPFIFLDASSMKRSFDEILGTFPAWAPLYSMTKSRFTKYHWQLHVGMMQCRQ